jgi:tetratricopeptide (TPR) repeat protein
VALAENELMYDPEKGIIFVEKGTASSPKTARDKQQSKKRSKKRNIHKSSSDIHIGRKKDPPKLYFKSGLEYYKNNDFSNAYKNFIFADSVDHQPEYRLWIGKTLRKLNKIDDMLKTMFNIIKEEPDCEVADDALLELALYYKMANDYEKATQLFTRLIEQYPFGLSFSTGEELREIAREQRRLMRAEMINILTTLGYIGEDLPTSYHNFQKANDLPVTETGNLQTVIAIKNLHKEYLKQQELKSRQQQQFERYHVWIYIMIAAGCINIVLLLMLLLKAKGRKKQLVELQKIVTDLDVNKL